MNQPIVAPLFSHYAIPLAQPFCQAKPCVAVGETVLGGQPLATTEAGLALLAPTSGVISALENRPSGLTESVWVPVIVLASDGLDKAYLASPITQMADLGRFGLSGLGGANYPSNLKLAQGCDTLIINAMECEPGLTADKTLMAHYPAAVIDSCVALATLVGAQRVLFAIENNQQPLIAALTAANQHRLLEIKPLTAGYPSGSEPQLIKQLCNFELAAGRRPNDYGIACFNVSTVYAIGQAIREQQGLTQRLVTITAPGVTTPKTVWLKLGTQLTDLLAWLQINTTQPLLMRQGGAIMGQLINQHYSIGAYSNALQFSVEPKPTTTQQPCIRCGDCAAVCPMQLQPQLLLALTRGQQLTAANQLGLNSCIECRACDQVCPSDIPLGAEFAYRKKQYQQQQQQKASAAQAKIRYQQHQQRLAQTEQRKAKPPAANLDKQALLKAALSQVKK